MNYRKFEMENGALVRDSQLFRCMVSPTSFGTNLFPLTAHHKVNFPSEHIIIYSDLIIIETLLPIMLCRTICRDVEQ